MMSNQFKFGMVVDAVPLNALAKGWEYFEVPAAIHGNPFANDYTWEQQKAIYKADGRPCPVTAFMLDGITVFPLGVKYDREMLEFAIARTFKRMSELGVKYIGCWGGHFTVPDGFSRNKAIDQALSLCNIVADYAEKYGFLVALEPMAGLKTLFPRYLEGVEFAKLTGRSCIKVMVDLNYFLELDQPLDDILKYPDYPLNVHIQGDGGSQPNVGNRPKIFTHLFEILKEIGYDKGVSAACPWVITNGAKEIDYSYETNTTLAFLQNIKDKVYK
jgi:sugar phosphate isomerase/epimerase